MDKDQSASAFAPATATLLAVGQECGGAICQCLARLHPKELFYLIGGKYRSDAMAGTSWSFQPHNIVVFRHNEASPLRRICHSLRWEIVSDTVPDPNDLASW
jgi:hypothetical protein